MWRKYEEFLDELSAKFPHERKGIKKFYDECWRVFNSLNSLDLKSLEEPKYLLGGRLLSRLHSWHALLSDIFCNAELTCMALKTCNACQR